MYLYHIFKNIFYLKIYKIIFFIFDINTSKQFKHIKKINFKY